MPHNKRTDLALEAREIWRESADKTTELKGVEAQETEIGSFKITTVKILDKDGEVALGKPIGTYITVEIDGLIRREENSFSEAVNIISDSLKELLCFDGDESVLIAGLGNEAITPDAIGPVSVDNVMVTRHLRERAPEYFSGFRDVAALRAGVLGTTGIESADLISSVTQNLKPDRIIAIDALASMKMERLCRTVQISDTGIVPGSGVGNSRSALSRDSMGTPVIAIGVPTVVDASTLAADMLQQAGIGDIDPSSLESNRGMIVTPRDIDRSVRDISKLIGYSLNCALHEGLTIEDIDMFLS